MKYIRATGFWSILLLFLLLGCNQQDSYQQVVVYTASDRQFSEPILDRFEEETGIDVRVVYDTEAVKTVGLVNRIIAERDRPQCDVFWNNEILRSIQLKEEGLTQEYRSPSAEGLPAAMKDPQGHWTGFAARARVHLVNTELLPKETEWPRTVDALADPKWENNAAFAKPLFGTTSTHAAVIWAMAGAEEAKAFWNAVFDNAVMEAGNAMARDRVRDGELAWCLTDTDDAYGAVQDGAPVRILYPESGPSGEGTLFLPNTLVLIEGAPHAENGKRLIDFLLSAEVEAALAKSRSAQIPVRPGLEPPPGLPPLTEKDILSVEWEKVYDSLDESQGWLEQRIQKVP